MALVLKDRVKETTTVTGTGTLTLLGAPAGYQAFSAIGNGNTCYYAISSLGNSEWEVGIGTYTSSGTTLSRDTVLSSSAAGALVDFPAGVKDVYVVYPAEKAIFEQANGETIINAGPITVVGANVTSIPALPAELGKFIANVDLFAQIYNLNQSSGSNASADFVAYNSDTDVNGTTFFADMGINSPNYSSVDYPIFTPNSAYYFSYGDGGSNTSTLFLGSGDGDVRIFAGGLDTNNTAVTIGTDLSTTLAGSLNVATTLNVTGAATFANVVTLNANPTLALQAATKQYVDAAVATGFVVHDPVNLATVAALSGTPTYNNGTLGVGATLTAAGVGTLSVDGKNAAAGFRILVKDQANAAHNGVYSVTTEGTGGAAYVLTRTTDFDTASAGEIANNAYFFVSDGNTLKGFSFVLSQLAAIVVGTTALPFTEFASQLVYTGGTNINVSGQIISLTGTVGPTNGGTGVNTVTTGDLLYGSGTNTWSKLALGAANRSLIVNGSGTQVEWNAVALGASGAVSGTLDETNGGTGNSTYVLGDTLYSSAANTLAKLAGNTTTTKKFLGQTGTGATSAAPVWEQPAATDITGLAPSATTDTTNADNITSGTLNNARTSATASNGASTIVARDINGSFAANLGAFVSVSGDGSAVTSLNASALASGTAPTARLASGTANSSTFLRGDSTWSAVPSPNNGTLTMNVSGVGLTGSASFTADQSGDSTFTVGSNATNANGSSTIVARDASGNFAANTITATLSGNATNVTGIVAVANGGTGSNVAATAATNLGLGTASNVQHASLGIGTAASGTAGEIRATNNVTAFFSSDVRLKENIKDVDGALAKVCSIGSKTFDWTEAYLEAHGGEDGYFVQKSDFGVVAQDVQAVFPQAVRTRPDGTLAVDYEKLATLAFGAIKELVKRVEALEAK